MRPLAVALLLPWLAAAASPQPPAEPLTRAGGQPNAPVAAVAPPLTGWSLLASDPTTGAAVLRTPDGAMSILRVGDALEPFAEPPAGAAPEDARIAPSPLPPAASLEEILADRVVVRLEPAHEDAPDTAWIHLAAAAGRSRIEYLRRRPLAPTLHERPVPPLGEPRDGTRRSPGRRPE